MATLNVGIATHAMGGAGIWSGGPLMDAVFLAMLLRGVPAVGKLWLIDCGGAAHEPTAAPILASLDVQVVGHDAVTHEVDLVIELGARLPAQWMARVRALGARTVLFAAGQTYCSLAEAPLSTQDGVSPLEKPCYDEVWIHPQHLRSCASLLRVATRAPVHVLPHTWAPCFIEPEVERCEKVFGRPWAYERSRQPWTIGIFEPNASVSRTCFIPLLVCEAAYRTSRESVGVVRAMNSVRMTQHLTFNRFASHLDLVRDHRASFEPRLGIVESILSQSMDCIVAHQWESDVNYLYYDVLHGGYPLVHNSETLRGAGAGIFYPHFEAGEGAQALLRMREAPREQWQDMRAAARSFLAGLSPEHPANLQAYAARLAACCSE